jgi:ATP-dependent DNA helicase RecQ
MWERVGGGLRLVSPDKAIERLPIDWALLARRRTAELNKLDAVQTYVYAKGCRRGFVLRYFGDPAAMSKCNGCDNCLGIAVARPPAGEAAPRKIRGRKSSLASGVADEPARPKQREKASRSSDDISLDAGEQKLFEALRATRSEIARKEKLPAYIVFWDRTLAEIAKRRPQSLAALRNVPGVGEAKLERYGSKILAVIRR